MRGVFNLAKMGFEKISRMEIHSLETEGKKRLSWAESNMPVLASIRQRFENEKPLQGTNTGVALHLEKKTGILLRTLVAGGAQLSAASCNPLTTDDSIAGALAEEIFHHPDIFLTWGKVKISIWTHKIDGLNEADFIFAAKLDNLH